MVPKCLGAEVSWGRTVRTLRHQCRSVFWTLRHWYRSVLVPKCLGSEVSGYRQILRLECTKIDPCVYLQIFLRIAFEDSISISICAFLKFISQCFKIGKPAFLGPHNGILPTPRTVAPAHLPRILPVVTPADPPFTKCHQRYRHTGQTTVT